MVVATLITLVVEVAAEMTFVITQIETQITAKTTRFWYKKCSGSIILCIILAVQNLPR